ncbi:cytochrome P450 [Rhizobium sp. SAFR-030]|uniref:cytochrome P450 n=1 Tax=Rhizobium sp. SAFR-030 TaxID=3387277 RepID=UPI003F8223F8
MLDTIQTAPLVASSDLEADIHGVFAHYRPSSPFISLDTGGTMVLRYDDVSRLLRDPRVQATGTAMPAQAGITQGSLFDIFEHGVLTANDDVHTRRRSALSRAFAPEVLNEFRQHVGGAANALIDTFHDSGSFDLASDYAAKLPLLALAGLLGIPEPDVPSFMRDVHAMNEFFRPAPTEQAVSEAEHAALRLRNYLDDLLKDVEKNPSQGFLARYLTLSEEDELTRLEVLVQIVQLIIGGTESVRTALVAQTVLLLSEPEQWKAVCDDPALVPNAVAEGLRLEPGIAGVVRVSVEEIEIDGWMLPAGQLVLLSFISALRDERVFDRPNAFDITRPNLKLARLAFGGGAHKCVADALGMAELEEGLSVLTQRLPGLRLDGTATFHGHHFVRKTSECRVSWKP